MENQPQNPEFSNNPDNFYPCASGKVHYSLSPMDRFNQIKSDGFLKTVCLFCLFLLLYVPCQQLWSLRDGQFT